jgi:CDP-diacylglycerol--serine O-phosphatidyltransferase
MTETNSKKMKKQLSMHVYVLPNLLTTGNLFFGFYAIVHAIHGRFLMGAYAIVAAAVFDLLDGRMARLTRTTSKFGAEYDSLSDLSSFCIAPALITYLWALQPFGRIGWLAVFFFIACGALRLARFNVQADVIEKSYFQGLPTPMAAGIIASAILAFNELQIDASKNIYILGLVILLGATMVSNFRYRSFKDLDLKERLPFRYLVMGLTAFAFVAYWPEVMLFFLFLTYAVMGVVFGIMRLGKRARLIKKNVYNPGPEQKEGDLIEEEVEDDGFDDYDG